MTNEKHIHKKHVLQLDVYPGSGITDVCHYAYRKTNENKTVIFNFNGVTVIMIPENVTIEPFLPYYKK